MNKINKMGKYSKQYPGNLVFSCGVEKSRGDESITLSGITVIRIREKSSYPIGKRLAKKLNKQFSKYNFPGINIDSGFTSGKGWSIN